MSVFEYIRKIIKEIFSGLSLWVTILDLLSFYFSVPNLNLNDIPSMISACVFAIIVLSAQYRVWKKDRKEEAKYKIELETRPIELNFEPELKNACSEREEANKKYFELERKAQNSDVLDDELSLAYFAADEADKRFKRLKRYKKKYTGKIVRLAIFLSASVADENIVLKITADNGFLTNYVRLPKELETSDRCGGIGNLDRYAGTKIATLNPNDPVLLANGELYLILKDETKPSRIHLVVSSKNLKHPVVFERQINIKKAITKRID